MKKIFILEFIISFCILSIIYSFPSSIHADTCLNDLCWETKASMPTKRRALGVAADSSGDIYALGGFDGNGNFLSILEKYDPNTDTWTTKAPMPTARISLSLVSANGKLYAIGGLLNDNTCTNTVEEYDPSSDTWRTRTPMPTARCGMGAIVNNNKIYTIGGHLDVSQSHNESSSLEEYDPSSDTWRTRTPMPTARSYPAITISPTGNIYVIGGNIKDPAEEPVTLTNIVEEYNISTNTWTNTTPFPINAFQLGAALGKNNKIYVIGGQTNNAQAINNVYAGSYSESNSLLLNVPILKQTDALWKNQTYDHAQVWNPKLKTIDRWGCALTSAAMILKFHGINILPNGNTLNPGSLNTWLKNQTDGYIGTGWLNWLAISRLSKEARQVNEITTFEGLEYSRINGTNKEKFKEDIKLSIPDILEEPGHFVVGKGFEGDNIEINDPFYSRNTLDDGYSNTFLSLSRFVPSNTDLSYIMITTNPEIHIDLRDANGNPIGESFIQQPLVDDINILNSNKPIKILYLEKPITTTYHLEISSEDERHSNLNIFLYDINGKVKTSIKPVMTGPNASNTFIIDFNKEDYRNSKSKKMISFKTLVDDIILGKKLKLISPIIADNLIRLAKNTQINIEQDRKIIAKIEINTMEKILNISRETLVKEPSFSILISDLQYLKTTF